MTHWFLILHPPRPQFPADITPAERAVMQQHVEYWRGLMQRGMVVGFGPVMDPDGNYGVAILRLEDEADPHTLTAGDPVIVAGGGFRYDVRLMPSAVYPAPSR